MVEELLRSLGVANYRGLVANYRGLPMPWLYLGVLGPLALLFAAEGLQGWNPWIFLCAVVGGAAVFWPWWAVQNEYFSGALFGWGTWHGIATYVICSGTALAVLAVRAWPSVRSLQLFMPAAGGTAILFILVMFWRGGLMPLEVDVLANWKNPSHRFFEHHYWGTNPYSARGLSTTIERDAMFQPALYVATLCAAMLVGLIWPALRKRRQAVSIRHFGPYLLAWCCYAGLCLLVYVLLVLRISFTYQYQSLEPLVFAGPCCACLLFGRR